MINGILHLLIGFEDRLESCNNCEFGGLECELCGCNLLKKITTPNESCPIDKWGPKANNSFFPFNFTNESGIKRLDFFPNVEGCGCQHSSKKS